MIGLKILDPFAAILICILIFTVASDVSRTALGQFIDKAADKETWGGIRSSIQRCLGVRACRRFEEMPF